jgi:hypothetical protein
LTQNVSISNQGSFYPTVVESAIDRAVMEIQQLSEEMGRSIVGPISDISAMAALPSAAQRAGRALIFDATGNPIAGVLPSTGVISSAMQPFTSASSLAIAKAMLGLGSMANENIGAGLQDDGAGDARVNFSFLSKVVNYAVASTDHCKQYAVTGPVRFTLPATSSLWNGFGFWADVTSDTLTLAPNGADSIEGAPTGYYSYVPAGSKAFISTDGAGLWRIKRSRTYLSPSTPGGYVSPASGVTSVWYDVISTDLYYVTDANGFIPLFNGAEWIDFPFNNLHCALNASQQLAGEAHDVFITLTSGGTPIMVVGPAWRQPGYDFAGGAGFTGVTNASPIVVTAAGHNLQNGDFVYLTGIQGNTAANGGWSVTGVSGSNFSLYGSIGNGTYEAGSGTFAARGVGVGSEISRLNGLLVNTQMMTAYNGSTPYTISSGQATYVGTILIDATPGQVTCHRSVGQSRRWGVFNAYNRKPITLKGYDPTASWTWGTYSWRTSRGDPTNILTAIVGVPEEEISCVFAQHIATNGTVAVGYASSYNPIGSWGGSTASHATCPAYYQSIPTIGAISVRPLETQGSGTYYGGETNMRITMNYRG